MTELDPLADVFPGTHDAPMPEWTLGPVRGAGRYLRPATEDPSAANTSPGCSRGADMTDERAAHLIEQVMHLAITIRDDGPEAAAQLLTGVTDPWAALAVAAALIHIDEPIDPWWQRGLDGLHRARRCQDCNGPIEGRGPAAVACEPCRVERRRASYRASAQRRRHRAAS